MPEASPPTLADAVLRRAPSRDMLDRLCAAIQPGGKVGTVRRLRGGIASGMHAVDLISPLGEHRWVVVRRYGAWRIEHDPLVAEREWATLTALARVGVPTPRPIWLDPRGELFGCPTIVISRVPGRGSLSPRDVDGWTRQLAEVLAQIHAAPLTEAELAVLIDQRAELAPFLERDAPPPDLAALPGGSEIWCAMHRWWPSIRQATPTTIVHGDYWPGNTLWRYGKLSGVIDWEQVRRGDPIQDVACCRLDLTLLAGPEAAEIFLRAYEAATGRAFLHLPFWELFVAGSALEDLEHWIDGYHDLGRTDLSIAEARTRFEGFTGRALAKAGAASPAT